MKSIRRFSLSYENATQGMHGPMERISKSRAARPLRPEDKDYEMDLQRRVYRTSQAAEAQT